MITKEQNNKSEEAFHDEWALETDINEIDVIAQFEGVTSPEYTFIAKQLMPVEGKEILNLGCGLGEEAVYFALKGASITAIDISKKMLELTQKLAQKYNVEQKIKYFHEKAESLSFTDNSFDQVVGCNVLHHVDLTAALKEVKRVLKPGGKAIFIEPLLYNPIINIYRAMASQVRTDGEHPISNNDFNEIRQIFPKFNHTEMHLFTLLIFVWFYVGERVHPNKARYWKKIIYEGKKYQNAYSILHKIDNFVLKALPFLRSLCWMTIIEVEKEA